MPTHLLETSCELPLPIREVFSFFSSAHNLARITPPEMKFQVMTPSPVTMAKGLILDYRLSMAGLPLRWRSLISQWEPPYAFTDEQIKGPYASWVHQHTFESTSGGTLIRDAVTYSLPFAPLGEIALPLVRRQLNHIFSFREKAIRAALLPAS